MKPELEEHAEVEQSRSRGRGGSGTMLLERADAACDLIKRGEVDAVLALSYVLWPDDPRLAEAP